MLGVPICYQLCKVQGDPDQSIIVHANFQGSIYQSAKCLSTLFNRPTMYQAPKKIGIAQVGTVPVPTGRVANPVHF